MASLQVVTHVESEYGSGMSVYLDLESNTVCDPVVVRPTATPSLAPPRSCSHALGHAAEAWKATTHEGCWRSTSEFVSSDRMTQYLVVCCWIFFWQTLTQTVLTVLPSLTAAFSTEAMLLFDIIDQAMFVFNIVYSMCYVSFLASYVVMHHKPPTTYQIGVLLYTLGYVTFASFFGILVAGGSWKTAELYLQGSLFFLVGSVFLVASTAPPFDMTWCLHKKDNALFWGCSCFLAGSVFFTVDSSRFIAGEESSVLLVALGYCFFTPGRLFVLWAVTTPEVGFSIRKRSSGRVYESSAKPAPPTKTASPSKLVLTQGISPVPPCTEDAGSQMAVSRLYPST